MLPNTQPNFLHDRKGLLYFYVASKIILVAYYLLRIWEQIFFPPVDTMQANSQHNHCHCAESANNNPVLHKTTKDCWLYWAYVARSWLQRPAKRWPWWAESSSCPEPALATFLWEQNTSYIMDSYGGCLTVCDATLPGPAAVLGALLVAWQQQLYGHGIREMDKLIYVSPATGENDSQVPFEWFAPWCGSHCREC